MGARSAYLRSAAEQPIDWYPWGPEPFELAKRKHLPILLDIGAVWCHWCHVMDEGTYSDGEVARLLRQHFITVKVDRDENPEVDRRYQRQVSALTGQGGWPLTAFLLPDGDVFLGGTYFPPEDGLGRPGFRRVLKEIARLWTEEPEKVRANAQAVRDALTRIDGRRTTATPRPPTAFLASVLGQVVESYDPVNGGFGFAPKFPHPTAVSYLLYAAQATQDDAIAQKARTTLLRMADGGVYDHIAGGFHRYATDEGWHIPHFEKMGADNAALLSVYVEGARRFGDRRLMETVRGIASWARSVLGDPAGGWGASQDADNAPGDDGGFFTWSRPELKTALDAEELRLVSRCFGVGADGRMPHDPERNVLYRLMAPAEAAADLGVTADRAEAMLAHAVQKLAAVRAKRPTPFVDPALYADINGGFLHGFVGASRLLGDPSLLQSARIAADRFLAHAFSPERGVAHLLGRDGGTGYGHLQDQGMFALGLVELAGATLDTRYVDAARQLLALMPEYAGPSGVLKDLAPKLYDGPALASLSDASYPVEDNPNLAGNAAVILAMLRLSALTGDEELRTRARSLLSAVQPRVEGVGLFAAGTALAAGLLEAAPARVVVEGTGGAARALRTAAERAWHPNLWVFEGTPAPPFALPGELENAARSGGPARALVCFGTRCLAPVTDPSELGPLLTRGDAPAP